jgi:hypothetical protein
MRSAMHHALAEQLKYLFFEFACGHHAFHHTAKEGFVLQEGGIGASAGERIKIDV